MRPFLAISLLGLLGCLTHLPAVSAAPADNLALRGIATQSSTGGGEASRAIDGNTDGNLRGSSVTHTGTVDDHPSWWEVDLGGTKLIGGARVWLRTDC